VPFFLSIIMGCLILRSSLSREELCGLTVTDSALAQALQRLAHWLKVEGEVILGAIRASPFIHIDETGWKIAGQNHWFWTFVNDGSS